MKLWALADAAAASISASVALGFPWAMLALMVVANRVGSWLTMPICATASCSHECRLITTFWPCDEKTSGV